MEHVVRDDRHLVVRVAAGGQAGLVAPQEVANRDVDGVPGGFLVAPLIDAQLLGLQRPQQLHSDSLDPPNLGPAQVGLLQKVEDGQ